jgi:nitroreductase
MLRSLYQRLPEPIRRFRHNVRANCVSLFWVVTNAAFDTWKYARFSRSFKKGTSQTNDQALLTFYYHKIEKGLALPSPKRGFGASWIPTSFLPLLDSYTHMYGVDDVVATCRKALEAYLAFHASTCPEAAKSTIKDVQRYLNGSPSVSGEWVGGVKKLDVKTLEASWKMDFSRFASARHSVRVFARKAVSPELIAQAVSIAQKAPSVCNRQAWRVYGLRDPVAIRSALSYQNGNAGFGDQIPCLLLVTCETSVMLFNYERNQIWIDGGLFSMALLYALQSLGLASCCLNLCIPWTVEKRLAYIYRLPASERPIMMIAVGHLPDSVLVAHSQRKPLSTVLTWSDPVVVSNLQHDLKA